jgi:cobaltochelatase CobN
MELPNIYPYIINDPSEGTQAKRRSYACIVDHLTPACRNADLYEELGRIETLLDDYHTAAGEDPGKLEILRPMIWEAVAEAALDHDLGLDRETALADFDAFREKLHAYLGELGDTLINDGLHTLGAPPKGERLIEFLAQLTRLDNGAVPSLRESLIQAWGFSYDELLENRGRRRPEYGGRSGAQVIADAHDLIIELLGELAATGFSRTAATPLSEHFLPRATAADRARLEECLNYVCEVLVPNLERTTEELEAVVTALGGGFVKPGPSGAPSRGQADILPTGRNFYSVDPQKIPSPAAWEIGKRLGDALIQRCLDTKGDYPDSIGILVYGGATMRTRGDDIAEIFYLMGLKPVWQKSSGNVTGLEVIPLEELGRPRLDVIPRVSGFFRDAFPNLMERIDEAVALVSALKEPPEKNILRRNVLIDLATYRKRGLDPETAWREATFRVFSCPPGTYGAGVSELVETKNWEKRDDLGRNYIAYSAHAYGRGSYGLKKPENFRHLLGRMEITVKNEDSREYDMMSCTDYYNYYGGLIAAAETVRGTAPLSYMGDSSDPKRVRLRSTAEEARHVLRSRLVNPRWLTGMQRHGYKGAGDISHMLDVVFGWDATTGVIEDWMYESLARKIALDPAMREWMEEVNPHARQNILDKLLEAIARGMWQAEPEIEAELRDAYLEIEGEIEERSE